MTDEISPPQTPQRPGTRPTAPAGRLPAWVLAGFGLLLLATLTALGLEVREVARLEAEMAAISGQLTEAREALSAHRDHVQQVRSAVTGLQSDLRALQELVDRDPAADPAAIAP